MAFDWRWESLSSSWRNGGEQLNPGVCGGGVTERLPFLGGWEPGREQCGRVCMHLLFSLKPLKVPWQNESSHQMLKTQPGFPGTAF